MVTVLCTFVVDMADPKAHMEQVTYQRTQLQDKDESAVTQSEFMHRVSRVRRSSLPFQQHATTTLYVTL